MTKAELSAKWSKYCDTDKLVEDMRELLGKNGHKHSEHGVCTVLDTYFKNKEPLIKLFQTSNHYIGNMRIILEKEFERRVDANGVSSFCYSFSSNVGAENILYKYVDDEGKKMTDYLATGCMKIDLRYIANHKKLGTNAKKLDNFYLPLGITNHSRDVYQNFDYFMSLFSRISLSTLISNIEHDGLKIPAGTKTSRAFNRMCAHYGIDKAPNYNKLFAQYADLVASGMRKLHFVISLNPLDYLTMSNGVSWTSCHSINAVGRHGNGNMCAGGCMSYLLDKHSIITYVVHNIEEPIHETGKLYRQMFYCGDTFLIQSRLYPQGNDGAVDLYDKFRVIMQEEFTELFNLESSEWCRTTGADIIKQMSRNTGFHYVDVVGHASRNGGTCCIIFPKEKTTTMNPMNQIEIGHASICTHCGDTMTNPGYRNRLACDYNCHPSK